MGDQRKEGQKEISMPGTDVFICLLRSWMWDTRKILKGGRNCGVPFLKKGRWDWGIVLSPLKIGKESNKIFEE